MSVAAIAGLQLYESFIKCGEILKSPPQTNTKNYVFRCIVCRETFILMSSFIIHSETHKSSKNTFPSPRQRSSNNESSAANAVGHNEKADKIKSEVKVDYNEDEEDPLNTIKVEVEVSQKQSDCQLPVEKSKTEPKENDLAESGTVPEKVHIADDIADSESEQHDSDSDYELPGPSFKRSSPKTDTEESDISIEDIDAVESDYEPSGGSNSKKKPKLTQNNKQFSSAFAKVFFRAEKNVNVLIESYRNQPDLWNTTSQQSAEVQSQQTEQSTFQKIASELKEKLNMDLSCKEVAGLLTHLRKLFLQDLKHHNAAVAAAADGKQPNDRKQNFKYFEQLKFLEPFIEDKRKMTASRLDALSEDNLKVFLDIYKNKPFLWNTHTVEYHCRNKRQEAIAGMLEEIEARINVKMPADELKKYVHQVNTYFIGEKRRRLSGKESKSCKHTNLNSKHYELMAYLDEHLGPFKCAQCDYEAQNSLSLRVHISNHDGSIPFTCSLCDKQYANIVSFRKHAQRHMNDCRHTCSECNRRFITNSELQCHMRVHTGVKPFCCDICGQSFRHLQTFDGHMRRHEKRYLHHCHICNRGFYTKEKVNNHIKAHLQIRDCICNVCGKAFTCKRLLSDHKVIHEDVRRFACELCGKTFKLKKHKAQHMKTHNISKLDKSS